MKKNTFMCNEILAYDIKSFCLGISVAKYLRTNFKQLAIEVQTWSSDYFIFDETIHLAYEMSFILLRYPLVSEIMHGMEGHRRSSFNSKGGIRP
jgi:hypothetical protein